VRPESKVCFRPLPAPPEMPPPAQVSEPCVNVRFVPESFFRSHEARIAGQILSPISKIARRHQHHRKRDTHPVPDGDA
jgi:hypothetical protein